MPMTREELDAIVEVVSSRLETQKAEIMAEFYTAIEGMRADFYNVVQQLGTNQTNLYEFVATRVDPGVLMAEVHEFWKRSVLAEAERVRREVEAATEFEFPDEPEEEPESMAKVKVKPEVGA